MILRRAFLGLIGLAGISAALPVYARKEDECAFCGKNQYQVKRLVMARKPKEMICDECICLGASLLETANKSPAFQRLGLTNGTAPVGTLTNGEISLYSSAGEVRMMINGKGGMRIG